MTRFWFRAVALLALSGGEAIAEKKPVGDHIHIQLGELYYNVNAGKVIIVDYKQSATGEIVIPPTIDGKPVTSIWNNAFAYCAGLTGVKIPDSVTSISHSAFNECTGLTAIIVDQSHPTYSCVDGILFSKDQTMLVQYPAGKTGTYTIPDSVTTIREHAFYCCPKLTGVTIGDSVTSIGRSAFARCPGLTSMMIPNSVTSIAQSTFARCTELTNVTIGNSVTSIGNWAFIDCAKLTNVNFEGNAPKTGEGIFTGVDTKNLKLHVYQESTGFELKPWDIHADKIVKRPKPAESKPEPGDASSRSKAKDSEASGAANAENPVE